MLHHSVWLSIADRDTVLCFACTEKRLGRCITVDDLLPCLLTDEVLLGMRLAWRLLRN
jgi:hypothetical protein